MRDVRDPVVLRPLGFGEIFDRAITLYLRNFWPFVGIALIALIPLAIMQYSLDSSQSSELTQVLGQLSKPHAHAVTPLPGFAPGVLVALLVGVLLALLVQPLVYGAIAFGVERLYKSEPVAFRPCMGVAWKHWPRLMGLVAVSFAIALVAYMAVVVVVAGVVAMAFFLHGAFGTAVTVALGIAVVAAAFVAFLWIFAALTFALFAVVVEDLRVFAAIGSGFRRVFDRKERWRALGIVVCSSLIAFFAGALLGVVAEVIGYLGMVWLQAAIETLSSLVVVPFSIILMAIYYFDVRVRREGLDFERRQLGLKLREE